MVDRLELNFVDGFNSGLDYSEAKLDSNYAINYVQKENNISFKYATDNLYVYLLRTILRADSLTIMLMANMLIIMLTTSSLQMKRQTQLQRFQHILGYLMD